jgi:hypothetical protein
VDEHAEARLAPPRHAPSEFAANPVVPMQSEARAPAEPPPIAEPQSEPPARTEVEGPVVEEPAPEVSVPQVATVLAELRGRFLLPDGSPAKGVKLELHGWQANSERVRKHGVPETWESPKGETDNEGRFALRFDPPLAFQFVLDAKLAGHGGVSWRWSELAPREVTDVGDTTLVLAGSIRGRVVDAAGRPAGGTWRVYGESLPTIGRDGGRDSTRVQASADVETGEFMLDGLPAGKVKLKAQSPIANWIDGPDVEVRVGETVTADITYTGPAITNRITVITFNRPLYVFNDPAPGSMTLHGPGVERVASKLKNSSQSWSFDDVPPGTYTVRIDDPLFLPWSLEGVTPGTAVQANLQLNGAVALEVVDAQGKAVADYRLAIDFPGASFGPSTFELRERDAPEPKGGVYRGLVPGSVERASEFAGSADLPADFPVEFLKQSTPELFDLIVEAEGLGRGVARVDGLRVGETRAVRIELSSGAKITGQLVNVPEGHLEGVSIVLAEERIGVDGALEFVEGVMPGPDGFVVEERTDADGSFAFEGLQAGSYVVVARFHHDLFAETQVFRLDAGQTRELRIEPPPYGGIEGRLVGSPEELQNAWVEAIGDGYYDYFSDGWSTFFGEPPPRARVSPDGSFVLPLLAGNTYQLTLHRSRRQLGALPRNWGERGVEQVLLGRCSVCPPQTESFTCDLASRRPGTLRIVVTVDGEPVQERQVHLYMDGYGRYSYSTSAVAKTDSSGTALFERLQPGNWNVAFGHDAHPRWPARSSTPVLVNPGVETRARLDIRLHLGRLLVVDAAGEPRANFCATLFPSSEKPEASGTTLNTDAEGFAQLKLPHTLQSKGMALARRRDGEVKL